MHHTHFLSLPYYVMLYNLIDYYYICIGYFSAWAGLAFTTHWALNIDVSKFTELDKVRKAIFCMGLAGAVTFFACIPPIIAKNFVGQSAWGLSAGLITVIVCAVLFKVFDEVSNQLLKVTTIIMFIMWATVSGVCTFDGPFLSAGNGELRRHNTL